VSDNLRTPPLQADIKDAPVSDNLFFAKLHAPKFHLLNLAVGSLDEGDGRSAIQEDELRLGDGRQCPIAEFRGLDVNLIIFAGDDKGAQFNVRGLRDRVTIVDTYRGTCFCTG
jgi:hypothetical protein